MPRFIFLPIRVIREKKREVETYTKGDKSQTSRLVEVIFKVMAFGRLKGSTVTTALGDEGTGPLEVVIVLTV